MIPLHDIIRSDIASVLAAAVAQHGSKPALSCLGEDLLFVQLEAAARNLAAFFSDLGLQKGDRIALMLPNLAQFPVAFYAAQKMALICVSINPLSTPREMRHQLQDSGAKAIVILDLFAEKLAQILPTTALVHVIVTRVGDHLPRWKAWGIQTLLRLRKLVPPHRLTVIPYRTALAKGRSLPLHPPLINPDDLALLQYTGGTTGEPKGAMISHKNILANVAQLQEAARSRVIPGVEIVLCALPLYHIFSMTVNFLSFVSLGMQMVLVPRPIPISNTIALFKKYKITVITGVNTLFHAFNEDPGFQKLAPRSIKFAIAGGMALQESVARRFADITGCQVIQGFGLTEASPVTHLCPPELQNTQTIGETLPYTEAKIIDATGQELPDGAVGELIVRGPQVMQGYWQRPEETAKVLRDGWLYTGDLAYREQGLYYIVDRKKDMILVSGFNVYPSEVEDVLLSHRKVLEAAVVGVPHQHSGELVKAYVVAKDPSLTVDELTAYCRTQLSAYKRPKIIELRQDLPKSNMGKVLRRELRAEHTSPSTLV